MSCDKTHICLSCSGTFDEQELYGCSKCQEPICPDCGGEVITIEEYDEAQRMNDEH